MKNNNRSLSLTRHVMLCWIVFPSRFSTNTGFHREAGCNTDIEFDNYRADYSEMEKVIQFVARLLAGCGS